MKKQLHVHAIRHGEIILQPVSKMPKSEKQLATKHIVGHSETGHHHVLESKTEFEWTKDNKQELYVRLFEPAKLVHQKTTNKHKTLTISAGIYKVLKKTEYDPFQKVRRAVWD